MNIRPLGNLKAAVGPKTQLNRFRDKLVYFGMDWKRNLSRRLKVTVLYYFGLFGTPYAP